MEIEEGNKKVMKGFKAMNADMTCRGFKFEVGKTYETKGLSMCETGFHFCEKLMDVYRYYPKSADTVICEVEAPGKVLTEDGKCATDKIKIVRRLSERELLDAWITLTNSGYGNSGYGNSGYGNSGYGNSGDWNSGHGNSGDWNSGYGNSGYGNSGNRNSGNRNSGDGNSGNRNSGDGNSGYGNSGNRNSGDWNSGDGNSGYFNTNIPVYFFNMSSTLQYTKEFEARIRSINVKPIVTWVCTSSMTEQEKAENPSHKVTGGFLRKTSRHDWRSLTENDKDFIRSLPNFDDEIFQKISGGVSLLDEVEVAVNGQTKKISKAKARELGLIE